MPADILIVEDEEALATLLSYNLESEGYHVKVIGDGDEADFYLKDNLPDLLLLDWMLPGLSGIEICRRVRKRTISKNLPIIMLTARGEEAEKLRGLTLGADDYIVKPFSVPELLARIRAILRRSNPDNYSDNLCVGDIEINRDSLKVTRGSRPIKLGPTELRLLEFLMKKPERVFSRAQILDGVWGQDQYVDERTVDVHIGRLRAAIRRGKERDLIRTVRGVGYSISK